MLLKKDPTERSVKGLFADYTLSFDFSNRRTGAPSTAIYVSYNDADTGKVLDLSDFSAMTPSSSGNAAAERKRTEQSHPVGRIGSVEEIGALCAFLASAHGGFISGTTLLADGGRSALMQD